MKVLPPHLAVEGDLPRGDEVQKPTAPVYVREDVATRYLGTARDLLFALIEFSPA